MKPVFAFLLMLLAHIATAQDFSLFEKKEFTYENHVLPYRILFPKNYDRTKKYPVILFLHGSGERGKDNEKQLVHGAKLFLKEDVQREFPAIVIFPQCPEESYWSSVNVDRTVTPYKMSFDYKTQITWPLAATYELLKWIVKEEAVAKNQIYVGGLSMGGMGSFELVYRFPTVFAAAVPICGGGDDVLYDERVKKTAFRIFHGGADPVVLVEQSEKMVTKLKSLKAKVLYKEYPGVGHDSWNNAFAEPDFIGWMFLHKRKKVKL
jgi:predicted peptidase